MAFCTIVKQVPCMTKPNVTFMIPPLTWSSQTKGTASHINTSHNSKTERFCQLGPQNTGNAVSKRYADECRHELLNSGHRSFHQHSVCKLRNTGSESIWKRNILTACAVQKTSIQPKNLREYDCSHGSETQELIFREEKIV